MKTRNQNLHRISLFYCFPKFHISSKIEWDKTKRLILKFWRIFVSLHMFLQNFEANKKKLFYFFSKHRKSRFLLNHRTGSIELALMRTALPQTVARKGFTNHTVVNRFMFQSMKSVDLYKLGSMYMLWTLLSAQTLSTVGLGGEGKSET